MSLERSLLIVLPPGDMNPVAGVAESSDEKGAGKFFL